MEWIIYIAFGFLWGYVCTRIANKNSRDTTLAWLMGFLFGLFAVGIYLIIGQTTEARIKEIEDVYNKSKK